MYLERGYGVVDRPCSIPPLDAVSGDLAELRPVGVNTRRRTRCAHRVSIDSSCITVEPPRGSKCNTELTGSCRIHTSTDNGCVGPKVGDEFDFTGPSRGSGHRTPLPVSAASPDARSRSRERRCLARARTGRQSSPCPLHRRCPQPNTGAADPSWAMASTEIKLATAGHVARPHSRRTRGVSRVSSG